MSAVLNGQQVAVRSTEGHHGWGQHGPQEPWLAARQKIHEAAIVRYAACLGSLIVFFILIHWIRVAATKSRSTGTLVLLPFTMLSRFVCEETLVWRRLITDNS